MVVFGNGPDTVICKLQMEILPIREISDLLEKPIMVR